MFCFNDIHLKNIVLFDDVKLDLNYKGITVINGINKNATATRRNRSGEQYSGGSGKSLLASTILNMFMMVDPKIQASKAQAKKDAFYRKGAEMTLDWSYRQKEYSSRKYIKGSSFKYDINEAGNPKNFTTATSAEGWLIEHFPLTEDQVYATTYLDARRPQLSLVGSGANRFNFFSDLFMLDETYDEVKQHFTLVKDKLKSDKVKLEEINIQLLDLNKERETALAQLDGNTNPNLKKMMRKLEKLRALAYRVNKAKSTIKNHKENTTEYDEKLEKRLIKQIDALRSEIHEHEDYVEWHDTNQQAVAESNQLKKKIIKALAKLEIDSSTSLSKINKLQYDLSDKLKTTQHAIILQTSSNEKHKELSKSLNQLSKPRFSPKKIKQKLLVLSIETDSLSKEKKRLLNIKDGKCPTCGSEFNKKHLNKELKSIKQREAILSDKIKSLKRQRNNAQEYHEIKDKLSEIKYKEIDSKLHKQVKKWKQQSKQLESLIEYMEEYADIDIEKKPKNATKSKDIKLAKASYKEAKVKLHQQALAKQATSLSVMLQQIGFDNKSDVKKAAQKLESYDLDKMNRDILKYSSAKTIYKRSTKRIEKLTPKVAKLDKMLKRARVIDILVGAYGNTGLKRFACAKIAKRIEANMNNMAHLIFNEPYKFHFDVTQTNFHINYEDPKRGIFDIRNLSGYESRAFTVLSMLGILPELPSYMRTNILVLDEMDSLMDPPTKKLFCNELIPALNEIIPHIIVVSPQKDIYPNSRVINVVKSGATSKLLIDSVKM